jgi:hypothetical protein
MKKIIVTLLLVFYFLGFSQTQNLIALKTEFIAFEADDFVGIDGFGHSFFIKNNVLFKKIDNQTLQYQNLSLGKIKKVDLINPLKIVVFYEEFNTVVFLDSQMNEIQKIDFSTNELPIIATAIGMSGQNNLWIYNSLNQQIGLYDVATNQYKNLGVPIKENLLFYQTDFNYFHWIDIQNQWFTCSFFGRITNNGILESQNQMQLLEQNKVLYSEKNELYLLDRNLAILYKIEIVEKSFQKFYYKDQILSIFTTQGITNYKITLP